MNVEQFFADVKAWIEKHVHLKLAEHATLHAQPGGLEAEALATLKADAIALEGKVLEHLGIAPTPAAAEEATSSASQEAVASETAAPADQQPSA